MSKKILCLGLAVLMLVSVFALTGCELFEKQENKESDSRLPTTLSLIGITEPSTKPEAIKAVEDAINEITMNKYKTKIDLVLVTEDEYYKIIDERVAEAEHNSNVDKAIAQYNKYAERQAAALQSALASENASRSGKWKRSAVKIEAETVTTRPVYTAQETTVSEDGIISILYPAAASPIDIVMISGKEMYDRFSADGLLAPLSSLITSGTNITDFRKFNQYIYPTYFEELKAITGEINAIPTNNLLAEYTYIAIDKELADKYSLNIDNVNRYSDISDFLASVKAEGNVTPMRDIPEPLGIFYPFGEKISIATYFDPIFGFSVEEGKSFTISNLFDIKEYKEHLELIDEYTKNGYFDKVGDDFAVAVIKGDASIEEEYGDEYYVKVIQNPFVEEQAIFDGMMAVTTYTSSDSRSLEIIQALNTDPELKNLLQYGIKKEKDIKLNEGKNPNYEVNSDGLTIKRLNSDYMMSTKLTGNVYMGYPEEGQRSDVWDYYKLTNLDTALSPFLVYYLNSDSFETSIKEILKRAALSYPLSEMGYTYNQYMTLPDANKGIVSKELRLKYEDYLKDCLRKEGIEDKELLRQNSDGSIYYKNSLLAMIESANDSKYSIEWYDDRIVEKETENHFSDIITAAGLKTLAQQKIASIIGVNYSGKGRSLETYRTSAAKYYTNITYLRIMSDILLFDEMSESERAKYDSMTDAEFETALLAYVTENYIKENDLDDDKYDQLVKAYIASMLEFTDDLGNSYTVSWTDTNDERERAEPFAEAVDKLTSVYSDVVAKISNYANMTPVNKAEAIHDALYREYLSENETTMAAFQLSLYDEILAPLGTTKADLDALKNKDKSSYDGFVSRLKSKYKNVLLETYTADKLKETGTYALTTSDALNAILKNKIEEKTQIYHSMADNADIGYSRFVESKTAMINYIKYVNMMRTKNWYTLTTVYSESTINAFKWDEIQQIVYENVYNIGFYTNEMVKLVGSTLSDYMLAKTNAANYINALNKLITYYKNDLTALGYDINKFTNEDPAKIEEVVFELAQNECSSGKVTLEELVIEASKNYVDGIDSAENKAEYCDEASKALSDNFLFKAVVETFKALVDEDLAKRTES